MIDNNLIKGYLAEQVAAKKLLTLDFEVSKPIVDTFGYDFICYKNGRSIKIQVKSLASPDSNNGYKFRLDREIYTNIDYFLLYLSDIDIWYILPINNMNTLHIMLYNESINSKYNIYKEAWNLLEV